MTSAVCMYSQAFWNLNGCSDVHCGRLTFAWCVLQAMHTLFLHVGIEADTGFGLAARIRGPNVSTTTFCVQLASFRAESEHSKFCLWIFVDRGCDSDIYLHSLFWSRISTWTTSPTRAAQSWSCAAGGPGPRKGPREKVRLAGSVSSEQARTSLVAAALMRKMRMNSRHISGRCSARD